MKVKKVSKIVSIALVTIIIMTGCGKSDLKQKTSENNTTITKEAKNTQEADEHQTKNIPDAFKETINMLNNIRNYQMPYFGGYTMKDKQVVLFSDKSELAVIWNADKSGKTKVVKTSTLPEDKLMSSFADGELNGVKTIYVMQEDPKQTFILAIHEGYHFYGQGWINKINFKSYVPRGSVYPENVAARVLMNQADHALRQLLEGKRVDGDKEALYFIEQARKHHEDDLEGNLNTAVSEGTANFIENLYLAVAKNPALMNQPKEVAKLAYSLNKANIKGQVHDKGMEYYQVASLPLYHLAILGDQKNIDMLMNGGHPLELLSKVTAAKEVVMNNEIKNKVEAMYQASNEQYGKYVENFKAKAENPEYVKVYIKSEAFPGSMQFGEFINYKVEDQYKTLNTGTTADAKLSSGIVAKVMNADTMNTDDYQYSFQYVKKADIVIKGNQMSIDTANLKVDGASFEQKEDGYIIQ